MPRFEKCGDDVREMAEAVLHKHESHASILEQEVRIDYVFAFGDVDENGQRVSNAIEVRGFRVLGQARKISPKDKAKGLGDAEILIDGDWWSGAKPEEAEALLDHELHHLEARTDKKDSQGRPVIRLRKHDVEIGWFACVAKRNGAASIERKQAKQIMDEAGQFFWPELAPAKSKKKTVEAAVEALKKGEA